MAELTKVRFVRSTKQGECDECIPEGSEMKLPAASVERWLRRGAIEIIADKPATKEAAKKEK